MKKIYILITIIIAVAVTACDTRDDYFYEHCDEPTVTFTTSDSDSVTVSGKRYVQIVLNWNETKKVDFSLHDKYGGISGVQWKVLSYSTPWINSAGNPYGYVKLDSTSGKIVLGRIWVEYDKSGSISFTEDFLSNDLNKGQYFHITKGDKTYYSEDIDSTTIILQGCFYNKLGVKGYTNIILNVRPNRPPVPVISVKKINDLEYTISAEKSYDPNGEEITKYDYCIDGTIIYNSASYPWERNSEEIAAVGGTYIKSTSLTSVNHAFQTTGLHTIYVRCKDKWGLWSKWTMLNITL